MNRYVLITFFSFVVFLSPLKASQILSDIHSQGYHEMLNMQLGSDVYDLLYEQYDRFMEIADRNPEWMRRLQFLTSQYSKALAPKIHSAPLIGYRSEKKIPGRNLSSFYYDEDFYEFLLKDPFMRDSDALPLIDLLQSLHHIYSAMYAQIEPIVDTINLEKPIKSLIYNKEGKLTLLLKLIRYDPLEHASITPHYDFTALTFFLDNTDGADESLFVSSYKTTLSEGLFAPPKRLIPRLKNTSSMLLAPGAFLLYAGIHLCPMPHAVIKAPKTRYSLVAFVLMPSTATFIDPKPKLSSLPSIQPLNN